MSYPTGFGLYLYTNDVGQKYIVRSSLEGGSYVVRFCGYSGAYHASNFGSHTSFQPIESPRGAAGGLLKNQASPVHYLLYRDPYAPAELVLVSGNYIQFTGSYVGLDIDKWLDNYPKAQFVPVYAGSDEGVTE